MRADGSSDPRMEAGHEAKDLDGIASQPSIPADSLAVRRNTRCKRVSKPCVALNQLLDGALEFGAVHIGEVVCELCEEIRGV